MRKKQKLELRTNSKLRLSTPAIVTIASTSIAALIVALVFIFNVGNVKDVFGSSSHTWYSLKNGKWNQKNTWGRKVSYGNWTRWVKGVPGKGDKVYINDKIVLTGGNRKVDFLKVYNNGKVIINKGKLTISKDLEMKAWVKAYYFGKKWFKKTYVKNYNSDLKITGKGKLVVYGDVKYDVSTTKAFNFPTYKWQIYAGKAQITMNKKGKLYLMGKFIRKNGYGDLYASGNSTVYFIGNNQQTLPKDAGTGNDNFHLNNVVIKNKSNNSPQIGLNGKTTVHGFFYLKKGVVKSTAANLLVLGDHSKINGFNTSTYIKGPYAKKGSKNFTFKFKQGSKIMKAAIRDHTKNATYQLRYKNQSLPNSNSRTNNLKRIYDKGGYYEIKRMTGSGKVKVTLYWGNANNFGITNLNSLVVAHYNSKKGKWESAGQSQVSGGTGNAGGSVTSTLVGNFSSFTFGDTTGTNPLPVELVSFHAKQGNDQVKLTWKTASEKNNSHFMVQRSENGNNFENLGSVDGHGTTIKSHEYSYVDYAPVKGTAYYRLKQVDFNGDYEYSPMETVNFKQGGQEGEPVKIEKVMPNPFRERFKVKYTVSEPGESRILVVNQNGQPVIDKTQYSRKGTNYFEYYNGGELNKGVYIFNLIHGDQKVTKKLLK